MSLIDRIQFYGNDANYERRFVDGDPVPSLGWKISFQDGREWTVSGHPEITYGQTLVEGRVRIPIEEIIKPTETAATVENTAPAPND